MNFRSEPQASMDELLEKNRPALTNPQSPQLPSIEIYCPLPEALERLEMHLDTLARRAAEPHSSPPSRLQLDELLKSVKHLEQMAEQAGRPKEKRFFPPGFRLPRLRLPQLDGPEWVMLLMALAVPLLFWYVW